MSVKTPIKATFTGSDVTGLAEYQAADFIGVADGGTGAVTHTSNAILLGNGTNAIQSSAIQHLFLLLILLKSKSMKDWM